MERYATRRSKLETIAYLFLFAVCGVTIFLAWPELQGRTAVAPSAPTTAPARDTGELDRLKAQLAAMQAQLRDQVIVQEVPPGEAPQPIQVQSAPAPAQPENNAAPPPAPAPRPVIIVHQTSTDGAHQTVTGSGACKVSRVAARCGK